MCSIVDYPLEVLAGCLLLRCHVLPNVRPCFYVVGDALLNTPLLLGTQLGVSRRGRTLCVGQRISLQQQRLHITLRLKHLPARGYSELQDVRSYTNYACRWFQGSNTSRRARQRNSGCAELPTRASAPPAPTVQRPSLKPFSVVCFQLLFLHFRVARGRGR